MRKAMRTRATTSDIAAKAGLSQPTVSLILNRRGDELGIRPETQKRVLDIARKLNYVPNPLAKGLRGGKTTTIGMIWMLEARTGDMAREITRRVQRSGYIAYLADGLGDVEVCTRLLTDFLQRRVDGVVFQGNNYLFSNPRVAAVLRQFTVPLLVTSEETDFPADTILHDRLPAFREAADHLASTGRKRTLFVGSVAGNKAKLNVFHDQLLQRGLDPDRQWVFDIPSSLSTPADEAVRILNDRFPGDIAFDAVICMNDPIATGVMHWLRQRGIEMPRQVAVIGSNNSEFTPYQNPPLASVERNESLLADRIEHLLFSRLANPKLECRRETVNMKFIWRESAG